MFCGNPAGPPSGKRALQGLWLPEAGKRLSPHVFDEAIDQHQNLTIGFGLI
jgi:hypothetical protein